jgi:hypothetical protein
MHSGQGSQTQSRAEWQGPDGRYFNSPTRTSRPRYTLNYRKNQIPRRPRARHGRRPSSRGAARQTPRGRQERDHGNASRSHSLGLHVKGQVGVTLQQAWAVEQRAGPVVPRACFVPQHPCRQDSGPDNRRAADSLALHARWVTVQLTRRRRCDYTRLL